MNAVITGATKGMGLSISHKLAEAGYNLALCSRNPVELEELIAGLRLRYPAAAICGTQADCSDRTSLKQFTNFVHEHFNSTDVLVNNAGMYIPSDLFTEEDTVFDDQLALNLFAPYYLIKSFGRQMKARHSGHIINICSIAAIEPITGAASYAVTKSGLLGLTNVLREELRPFKVKVTAIIPGATLTSSWDAIQDSEDNFITAEDIAVAVLNCLKMSPGANLDEVVIRPVSKRP